MRLSVVVASFSGAPALARCLKSPLRDLPSLFGLYLAWGAGEARGSLAALRGRRA